MINNFLQMVKYQINVPLIFFKDLNIALNLIFMLKAIMIENANFHSWSHMNKTKILSYMCLWAFIGISIPIELMATTTHAFNVALNEQATEIQGLVFGPAIRIAGVLGAALGIGMSYIKQSFMPFLTFSAIGLVGGGLMPRLIDSVFHVTSMLLP